MEKIVHFLDSVLSSENALKMCFIFVNFWIAFFGSFEISVPVFAPNIDSESEPLFECRDCAAPPPSPSTMRPDRAACSQCFNAVARALMLQVLRPICRHRSRLQPRHKHKHSPTARV